MLETKPNSQEHLKLLDISEFITSSPISLGQKQNLHPSLKFARGLTGPRVKPQQDWEEELSYTKKANMQIK